VSARRPGDVPPARPTDLGQQSRIAAMPHHGLTAGAGRVADRSSAGDRMTDPPGDLSEAGVLDPGLLDLFEQITGWLDAGMPVDEAQLAADNPAWAREIRDLVPTLRRMARAGSIRAGVSADPLPVDRDAQGRRVVGDFHIVREIGRGGMGIVYEAEQAPLGRRVALKILSMAATLDPRSIQRFQLEAQVAGWLQHPRIVPVYAVGVASDTPYFAMQYIEGGSLASLIGEMRGLADRGAGVAAERSSGDSASALALGLLTGRFAPAARDVETGRHQPPAPADHELTKKASPSIGSAAYHRTVARLGIQAAEALGYAHDQGIIHRDVKPANLLLDRRGDLWIADFGMADVQGDAGMTVSGDLPGTLRYMSPEQATGQRALVDRRTDVYSLGATLYELLTLQPSVTGSDKGEIIRRIVEQEPTPIRRSNPAVPADLATIVTKALSKNPSNRYETAIKLGEDLERYLDGLPIMARPVGPLRRSWRWCRRKPVQAGLAAALGLALIGGFAGITWNWREAVVQRQEAERQKQEALRQKNLLVVSQGQAEVSEKKAVALAAKADAINRFLIDKLLRQAAPENNPVAKQVTLLEVLDRAAAEIGTSLQGQPETEVAIRLALGQTYHDLGDYRKSETHYRKALELSKNKSDSNKEARLQAMCSLGHGLVHLGGLTEAERLLESAKDELDRLGEPARELSLESTSSLADLRQEQGRLADAEVLRRGLVDQYRSAMGPRHKETLTAINNLGTLLQREQKNDEAERLFRDCLTLAREVRGERHPGTIVLMFNLGFVLRDLGRLDEAEPLIRQALDLCQKVLGPEHPNTLIALSNLGDVLARRGRLEDAEKLLRPCLESQRRAVGINDRASRHTAEILDAVLRKRAGQAKSKPSSTPR
jgi:serine/threonine protein kinase/Tfp pilus assembly protein PilF